ncbi:hypothetical protein ABMA28_004749 [Loxostege sticticalis]|uniref:Tonsoku-like protein n=1 Tax=Loxostege sticticalis TaxID=481309 RepID=A0ABD0SSA8_LOXSC
MEERLVKRKEKALKNVSRREVSTILKACNDLATYYHKHKRYKDALIEFEQQAKLCEENGLRMRWANCNRMIGQMYFEMAQFDKALEYVQCHLTVAKEHKNPIEELNAMETLGRIHLLQGQSPSNEEARTSLIAAQEAFMKSLDLCKICMGKITQRKLMDIHARLLLNIGDVQDHLGNFEKAIECIKKAMTICSKEASYEVLHNCYTTEADLHSKKKDYAKALRCLDEALKVASRLKDMVLETCETLKFKADILCKMSEYQNAKQVLLKAWKMKTPDEDARQSIETKLKIVVAMCETQDLLISSDPTDHVTLKKLYEKLGDGACRLNNYAGAVEYYTKALAQAELAGDHGKTLAPIYVSLYQTYKDMGCYEEALDYCNKEFEVIKDVPKEAFTTLNNIAEVLFLAKKPYHQVEKACLDARNAAKKCKKIKYEIRVLKRFLKYQKKYGETDNMRGIKAELQTLGYDNFDNLESSEGESSVGGGDADTTHIGDDVRLEELSDLSNTNEERGPVMRETRREAKKYTVKRNPKGETKLHCACIKGNKQLVETLLAAGHPVNVRDNAGWSPLHEACIHGRLEVASILINSGANVNDMGGINCSGITPLYDAATNGRLEVMELLLEKGAIPNLKTDFGETPLQALQNWRAGRELSEDKDTLYKYICNTIHCFIEKTDSVDHPTTSKTPVKPTNDMSLPSTSKMSNIIPKFYSPMRENIIFEESVDYDEITDLQNNENPTSGDTESSDDLSEFPEVELNTSRVTSVTPNEDDACLDSNLGGNKQNNKRKLSDPIAVITKKPLLENQNVENINNINESLSENKINTKRKKSQSNDNVHASGNSSESQNNQNFSPKIIAVESLANTNVCPVMSDKTMADSSTALDDTNYKFRNSMRLRYKRQSMIILDDESRNTDDDASSESDKEVSRKINQRRISTRRSSVQNNIGSDEEISRKDISRRKRKSSRHLSSDNTSNHCISTDQNSRGIEDISRKENRQQTPRSKSSRLLSSDITDDARQNDSGNDEEISRKDNSRSTRKLTGVRPVFTLMTSDGAILSEDDPLSLVLASPELTTSPSEERYLDGMRDSITVKPESNAHSQSSQPTSRPEAVLTEPRVTSTDNSPANVSERMTSPSQLPGPSSSTDLQDFIPSTSISDTEKELDDDILQLLGDAPKTESPRGPPINKHVANIWSNILAKGLKTEDKVQIMDLYSVPENCALLLAPTLNPEVKSAVRDDIVEHDSWLMRQQKQIGMAISALGLAVNSLIANKTSEHKILLKPISDACRLLCDIHFHDTEIRRNCVIGSISTEAIKDSLVNLARSENLLFGGNVMEKKD